MTRLLLESGSLVNNCDCYQRTPLHYAARNGDTKIAKLLLSFGANSHARNDRLETPMMKAAAAGHLDMIEVLSPSAADLQTRDFQDLYPPGYAAYHGRTNVLLYLLTKFYQSGSGLFHLSSKDVHGYSVIEYALQYGESSMFTALLNLAPDSNVYLPGKTNVLSSALTNYSITVKCMKMLFKRLPSEILPRLLSHRACMRGTPLYAASTATGPHVQCALIEMLLGCGAELDTEGGDCGTALMGACTMGRFQAVKLLVRKGAAISYRDGIGRGFSAPYAAESFPEIVHWLLVGRYIDGPRRLTI